jgi:hypothetical protein
MLFAHTNMIHFDRLDFIQERETPFEFIRQVFSVNWRFKKQLKGESKNGSYTCQVWPWMMIIQLTKYDGKPHAIEICAKLSGGIFENSRIKWPVTLLSIIRYLFSLLYDDSDLLRIVRRRVLCKLFGGKCLPFLCLILKFVVVNASKDWF